MRELLILLATYLLSGCQYDPYYSQYTSTKPTQTLIGNYTPTKETKLLLSKMYKNVKKSNLELRSDSSFSIKNIAAIWSPFATADGFEDIEGRWSLVRHQEWWAIDLMTKSIKEANGHWNQKRVGTQLMLIGQKPPYKLHFIIGDPDAGEALQYELK